MHKQRISRPQSAQLSSVGLNYPQHREVNIEPLENQSEFQSNSSKISTRRQLSTKFIYEQMQEAQTEIKMGLLKNSLQKYETIIYKSSMEFKLEQFKNIFTFCLKSLNFLAVDLLNKGDSSSAFDILYKCEKWTSQNSEFGFYPALRALTLNHIGCIYRRQGNFKTALSYYDSALNVLLTSSERNSLGLTYLNLSALYSQLNNHSQALLTARQALSENQHEFYEYLKQKGVLQGNPEDQVPQQLLQQEYESKVTSLAVSYHNVAAEEEYIMDYAEALIHHEASYRVCEEYLGADHKLTMQFKSEYTSFYDRQAQQRLLQNRPKPRLQALTSDPNVAEDYESLVKSLKKAGFSLKKSRKMKPRKAKVRPSKSQAKILLHPGEGIFLNTPAFQADSNPYQLGGSRIIKPNSAAKFSLRSSNQSSLGALISPQHMIQSDYMKSSAYHTGRTLSRPASSKIFTSQADSVSGAKPFFRSQQQPNASQGFDYPSSTAAPNFHNFQARPQPQQPTAASRQPPQNSAGTFQEYRKLNSAYCSKSGSQRQMQNSTYQNLVESKLVRSSHNPLRSHMLQNLKQQYEQAQTSIRKLEQQIEEELDRAGQQQEMPPGEGQQDLQRELQVQQEDHQPVRGSNELGSNPISVPDSGSNLPEPLSLCDDRQCRLPVRGQNQTVNGHYQGALSLEQQQIMISYRLYEDSPSKATTNQTDKRTQASEICHQFKINDVITQEQSNAQAKSGQSIVDFARGFVAAVFPLIHYDRGQHRLSLFLDAQAPKSVRQCVISTQFSTSIYMPQLKKYAEIIKKSSDQSIVILTEQIPEPEQQESEEIRPILANNMQNEEESSDSIEIQPIINKQLPLANDCAEQSPKMRADQTAGFPTGKKDNQINGNLQSRNANPESSNTDGQAEQDVRPTKNQAIFENRIGKISPISQDPQQIFWQVPDEVQDNTQGFSSPQNQGDVNLPDRFQNDQKDSRKYNQNPRKESRTPTSPAKGEPSQESLGQQPTAQEIHRSQSPDHQSTEDRNGDTQKQNKQFKDSNIPKIFIQNVVDSNASKPANQEEEKATGQDLMLDQDQEQLNQAASLIQKKYRIKKQNQQKKKINPDSPARHPEDRGRCAEADHHNSELPKENQDRSQESRSRKQPEVQTSQQPQKNSEKIEIEGDPQELNQAASFIQQKYRLKKQKQKKEPATGDSAAIKQLHALQQPKQEEVITIEGDEQELNKAASFIQKKYRQKKGKPDLKQGKNQLLQPLNFQKNASNSDKDGQCGQCNTQPVKQKGQEHLQQQGRSDDRQPQQSQGIEIEGDPEELNKAATLIQKKYKLKKQKQMQKDDPQSLEHRRDQHFLEETKQTAPGTTQVGQTQDSHKQQKPEQLIVIEGDPEELNKAASFIQKKYRMKKGSPDPGQKSRPETVHSPVVEKDSQSPYSGQQPQTGTTENTSQGVHTNSDQPLTDELKLTITKGQCEEYLKDLYLQYAAKFQEHQNNDKSELVSSSIQQQYFYQLHDGTKQNLNSKRDPKEVSLDLHQRVQDGAENKAESQLFTFTQIQNQQTAQALQQERSGEGQEELSQVQPTIEQPLQKKMNLKSVKLSPLTTCTQPDQQPITAQKSGTIGGNGIDGMNAKIAKPEIKSSASPSGNHSSKAFNIKTKTKNPKNQDTLSQQHQQ